VSRAAEASVGAAQVVGTLGGRMHVRWDVSVQPSHLELRRCGGDDGAHQLEQVAALNLAECVAFVGSTNSS
jgi:hypothetical protein